MGFMFFVRMFQGLPVVAKTIVVAWVTFASGVCAWWIVTEHAAGVARLPLGADVTVTIAALVALFFSTTSAADDVTSYNS